MLAAPRNEYPVFPAALSFAMTLDPDQVTGVLTQRLAVVQARLAHLDSQLQDYRESVPRIALIETEYQRAVTDAEARWLSSVIDDLQVREALLGPRRDRRPGSRNLLPGRKPSTRPPAPDRVTARPCAADGTGQELRHAGA
jgi:hypothetical protein